MPARILHLDIETAPVTGLVWGLWQQNIGLKAIHSDWYVLSWSAKWDGEDDVYWDALPEYPDLYSKDRSNDKNILLSMHEFLEEADIVVAHNGKAFDIKKLNARFLKHGILPPSPFKQVDTLHVVKTNFKLTSNKLDYVAQYLGLGAKIDVGGMERWVGCMNGSKADWDEMVKYNIQDVILLEKVYHRLLPWISNHPNLALYELSDTPKCPKCGGDHIQWRGYYITGVSLMRKFQCQTCGGWGRARSSTLTKSQRGGLTTNANL